MKKLIFTLFILCLPLFVGCSNELATTPNLNVYSGEEEIAVVKGGYEWSRRINWFEKQVEVADAASPEQMAQQLDGDVVSGNSDLCLVFTEKPDKVEVIAWGERKDVPFTATLDKISVPNQSGTYIYEILAQWPQGHVSYTIKIIVE
ncbi:MAG TPA: hypothetical protein DCY20_06510 [Firmicutes bacterium]|nr:hypothetical protein [Bacillota bacterium]